MLVIERAADLSEAESIIREYARSTGVDLEFQHFSDEIAHLDTYYDTILLARWDGTLAGCGALRDCGDGISEMKRLYVRDRFRGHDIGRALAERLIDLARTRGFRVMRLDTLPTMTDAMRLYESLGFIDIAPYRYNPVAGTRFMELALR